MLGQKIELLEALPIFKGLSRRQLASILDVAAKAHFEAGDNLAVRNSRADTTFLILTGAARCVDFPGNPAACEKVEAGSLIGELAMLVEIIHSLTVQASVRLRALAFRRNAMKSVMLNDPVIAAKISGNLLTRLQTFAADLRRLDSFLAHVEGATPLVYGIHAPEAASRGLLAAAARDANAQPEFALARTVGDTPDISTSATLPIPPESHDTLSYSCSKRSLRY
ncbi:MAG: cyclic nucleotide-binding domain-containing protein [Syntrophobacteraceae bacterium]